MANLDFSGRRIALADTLKADPRLEGVTVTTDLEDFPADAMDYVQVRMPGWSERPLTMAQASSGYDVDLGVEIVCVAVSHQSTGDAVRRRDELVNAVRNIVLDNQAQPDGAFGWYQLSGGQLDPPARTQEGQGSAYSVGTLRLTIRALA